MVITSLAPDATARSRDILALLLAPGFPSPIDLPNHLSLPAVLLGDLPALLGGSCAPAEERGQFIDFDADLWRCHASPVYLGAPHAVLAPDLRRRAPSLTERLRLRRRVPALSWHSHPATAVGSAPWPLSCPSLGDLATISLLPPPCRSRLHLIGAPGSIDALVIARPPRGEMAMAGWSAWGRPPVRLHRRRVRWLQDGRRRWQEQEAPTAGTSGFAAAYRGFLAGVAAAFGMAYYHADTVPAPGAPLLLRRVEAHGGQ